MQTLVAGSVDTRAVIVESQMLNGKHNYYKELALPFNYSKPSKIRYRANINSIKVIHL